MPTDDLWALIEAVATKQDNLEKTQSLLGSQANPNGVPKGRKALSSPLAVAIQHNQYAVGEELLKAGARLEPRADLDESHMHFPKLTNPLNVTWLKLFIKHKVSFQNLVKDSLEAFKRKIISYIYHNIGEDALIKAFNKQAELQGTSIERLRADSRRSIRRSHCDEFINNNVHAIYEQYLKNKNYAPEDINVILNAFGRSTTSV